MSVVACLSGGEEIRMKTEVILHIEILAKKKPVVETGEAKASADKPKAVRKNNGAPIIKDYVSDSEEEDVP
ncbi:hypothetical protein Tco_1220743 [Tanacetum coccineum]